MKVAVLEKVGQISIQERAIPEIRDDQMLIRVLVCGTCMSEGVEFYSESEVGRIFGHEPVGIVEKIGNKIKNFKPGDRVTGLFLQGFAEYTVAKEEEVTLVPESLSDEEAIVEPWSCLLSGISRMDLKPTDIAAVIGCGSMGLGLIKLLKIKGAGKIIAVDLRRESLELAKKFGADEVYTPDELPKEYIVDEWNDKMFIHGVDIAAEVTGGISGLELAGRMVRPHGILSIVGYHYSNAGMREINMRLWNWKAITVVNAHERRLAKQMEFLREALVLLEEGKLDAKPIMTHKYSFEETNQAFVDMKNKPEGYIKGYVRIV